MKTHIPLIIFSFCFFLFACKNAHTNNEKPVSETVVNSGNNKASNQHLAKRYAKLGIDTSTMDVLEALPIGSSAPAFSGIDQLGNTVSLESLTNNGPVVLIFYRGYWCPVCNRYLSDFAEGIPAIHAKGAKIVAITPELPDYANKTIEHTKLTIPVISDIDGSIMEAYKVKFKVSEEYQEKIRKGLQADIAETNGTEDAFLPVPATYIIDKDQKITYHFFDPNYSERASVEEILANL